MSKPLRCRQLKAEMALKDLRVDQVAARARMNYSIASQVLNGRLRDDRRLAKLSAIISAWPMPAEVRA